MAEWPKTLSVCDSCGRGEVEATGSCSFLDPEGEASWTDIPIIPADLGRELYEATVAYIQAHLNHLDRVMEEVDGVWPETKRLHDALARYEREVGK